MRPSDPARGAAAARDGMRELGVEAATPQLMTAVGCGGFIRPDCERAREAADLTTALSVRVPL